MLVGSLDFAVMLERAIIKQLQGGDNGKTPGLYQQILGSQNWEEFQRTKGLILGFEAALDLMRAVAREMNKDDEPIVTHMRAN
jgi:hypothetical protein